MLADCCVLVLLDCEPLYVLSDGVDDKELDIREERVLFAGEAGVEGAVRTLDALVVL